MWIHLLTLELIDGASPAAQPEPPYVPPQQSGGGGGGRGLRELLEKALKRDPKPQAVIAAILPEAASPEAIRRVIEAAESVKVESTEVNIAELNSILERLAARLRDLEDEESAVVSLLLT